MNKLILHIGMHKTGTSAIQNSLNGYSDDNVRYAIFNSSNHSYSIFPIFSKNYYSYSLFTSCGMSKENIDDYISIQKKLLLDSLLLDDRTVIVSGEDISFLGADELRSLIGYMKVNNRQISVYAYLRLPFDFSSSYFSEIIKNGEKNNFIDKIYYCDIFEKFINIFGDDLHLRVYDRALFLNGSVVNDFSDWLGLNPLPDSNINNNVSLSSTAVKIIYFLNIYLDTFIDESSLEARYLFIDYIRKNFHGKHTFTKDESEFFFDADDINKFQKISRLKLCDPRFFKHPKANFSVLQWASDLDVGVFDGIMPADIYDFIDLNYLPLINIETAVIALYWYFWIETHPEFTNFSPSKYFLYNPDVAESGLNPYVHFILYGCKEHFRKFS